MRLSTRDANAQGRLSKSPSVPLSQVDVSLLCTSAEAWPPLLPSFSKETVEAMDRFVQGFICRRIECRCGQLAVEEYEDVFLPRWLRMAEHRTDVMEDFFARCGSRLDEETFRHVFGAFERMQSAMRDARQECGAMAEGRQRDKRISFARPVAHRLIRRSHDRFSLRSIADMDESADLSRLSCSPCPAAIADSWRSSAQRSSCSPVPGGPLSSAGSGADVNYGLATALPVEESPDGDHFTGRASGVYYGDIFRSARCSEDVGGDGCGTAATRPVAAAESTAIPDGGADGVGEVCEAGVAARQACVGTPVPRRAAAWRRLWLRCVYHYLLPAAAVLLLALRVRDAVQTPSQR
ncbi:hypothetical protein NESM_000008400 [Novymonas esmeraldas]|uniref:Uncharacterized protein n=1 Tax=Novymonas esmeraldas TaxID=1808958 RepID=A0AAW0F0A9_9TRYP